MRDLYSIVNGDQRRRDSSAVTYYNTFSYFLNRLQGKGSRSRLLHVVVRLSVVCRLSVCNVRAPY